jgi:hypothetical protein
VYGISHPKYRAALLKQYPCLACANETENTHVNESSGEAISTNETLSSENNA